MIIEEVNDLFIIHGIGFMPARFISYEISGDILRLLDNGNKIISRPYNYFQDESGIIFNSMIEATNYIDRVLSAPQRRKNVSDVLKAGLGDSVLNSSDVANFFSVISGHILVYEREGINLIHSFIDNEIITNNLGVQSFLLSLSEDGIPVHLIIKNKIP